MQDFLRVRENSEGNAQGGVPRVMGKVCQGAMREGDAKEHVPSRGEGLSWGHAKWGPGTRHAALWGSRYVVQIFALIMSKLWNAPNENIAKSSIYNSPTRGILLTPKCEGRRITSKLLVKRSAKGGDSLDFNREIANIREDTDKQPTIGGLVK